MSILLKTFIASFVFFTLLIFTVLFAEDFMNKQGIYYPLVLNKLMKNGSSPSPQITPVPVVSIGNGDANASDFVDFNDIEYISDNWNYSAGGSIDQYQDGKVNSLDFAVIAEQLTKQP